MREAIRTATRNAFMIFEITLDEALVRDWAIPWDMSAFILAYI